MSEKNNATCSICGNGYHVCYSCKDSIQLHPWKMRCCSVDCYKTSQVVRGFSTGVYTKDEFKSKLKKLDLSNLENYREHIKAMIKDALKEDEPVVEPVKEAVEVAEEPVEEATETIEEPVAVTEHVVEAAEENVVVEKPIVSRKRNYKVDNEVIEAE